MKRIGIAASKMAKGNRALYNGYVVLISALFSLFIFVIAGASVVFALIIIATIGNEIMPDDNFTENWKSILTVCMVSLTVIIAIFNVFAITKNIKFPKGIEK